MYILAGKSKGIHNFVNHDKYKVYGCTRTHEFTKETRNVVQSYRIKRKGLRCVQIAHELGLHRHTVEKYVRMSLEEFQASQAYERDFKYKLDIFENEVKNELIRAPYLSSR